MRNKFQTEVRAKKVPGTFLSYASKAVYLSLFLCFVVSHSVCFASQDIVFEASVDRNTVALGESMQLSLTFQGATDVPAPQIQEPEGFSAKYLGPSTTMSIVNGRMSSSVSHIYVLIPLNAGKFTIGPFTAEYRGQAYQSQAIEVEVAEQAGQAQAQRRRSRALPYSQTEGMPAEEQLKDRIFVEFDAGKRDVYLNEIIPLTVRLYVNKLAIRDIEYPSLAADGFSKEKFKEPKQYQKALAGLVYDVIEFNAQAYPLKTGLLALGPAEIKCNLVVRRQPPRQRAGSVFDDFFPDDDSFSDFFSRYETYPLDLKSPEVTINVKPLPEENKPADFSGAIGEFDMQVEADPTDVKAGDPITLRIKISGAGNFASVNAPVLEDAKAFKAYQPQTKTEAGQKTFEQVIMPLSENVTRIPAVSFSFFDPKLQAYQTIKRGPIAITVSKPEAGSEQLTKPKIIEAPQQAAAAAPAGREKEEILGRDIVYIKEAAGVIRKRGEFVYKGRGFILLFAAMPVLFLFMYLIERKRQRLLNDTRYARTRRAYKKARKGLLKAKGFLEQNRKEEFYSATFKALQEYIGDRLHIPSAGITSQSAQQHLRQRAVPEERLVELKEIFEAIDAARFAPSSLSRDDVKRVLDSASGIMEWLERIKL